MGATMGPLQSDSLPRIELALVLVGSLVAACGTSESGNRSAAAAERSVADESSDESGATSGDEPAPDAATLFTTRSEPFSRKTRIFLVAGSSRAANFAQEIIDQRALWRAAGFPPEEIACYYVIPYQEELDADREQFLALAPELAACYPASMKLLRQHLGQAEAGDFVYLYITAHGERPVSLRLRDTEPDDDLYHTLQRWARHPILDEHRITLEALPDGNASGSELLGAYRAGVDARDLYLTPDHLAGMLARYRGAAKRVVLQACYSGGFIRDPRRSTQPLAALDDLVLLTAARHDRDSFGCAHGDDRTYYGGAYNDELARALAGRSGANPGLPDVPWRELHDRVSRAIVEIEEREGDEPSSPMLLTTEPAVSPESR